MHIKTLILTVATFCIIPSCSARHILENCSRNPYQEKICAIYHCGKILDPVSYENETNLILDSDASFCQISKFETDNDGRKIFPTRQAKLFALIAKLIEFIIRRFEEHENKSILLSSLKKKYEIEICIGFLAETKISNNNLLDPGIWQNATHRKEKFCTLKTYKLVNMKY